MFIISENKAVALTPQTFAELGLRERDHIQEWIADNPSLLGEDEELLIIQKEFAGWDETKERLDLLALDRNGKLVVIENKRDDSGADVTWQALKYASYCSTLTADGIEQIFQEYLDLGDGKKAADVLRDFFKTDDFTSILEQDDQRIILVAANFRKEVTSTVMWLFNRGIDIKCIKITPYKHGGDILIYPEQIMPLDDADEYQIKLAENRQARTIAIEEASELRRRSRLKFSEIGIQPGAELVFKDDPTQTCKVIDDRKVEYEGESLTLSALATRLSRSHSPGGLQGALYFTYEDELLIKRRDRLEEKEKVAIRDDLEVVLKEESETTNPEE